MPRLRSQEMDSAVMRDLVSVVALDALFFGDDPVIPWRAMAMFAVAPVLVLARRPLLARAPLSSTSHG